MPMESWPRTSSATAISSPNLVLQQTIRCRAGTNAVDLTSREDLHLTAAMRKLIIILNTLVRTDQLWRESTIG